MNNSIRVGNLFGIPFYINVSWFLVLALVTWNYGSGLAYGFQSLTGLMPWLLGLGAALLLFASVLAHELGHSFVAMSQGIGVRSITLFLFGGLAALERDSDSPSGAFWVAIAGPAVSLALFGLFTVANVALPLAGPLAAIVSLLAYVNLILASFNLIPGLPLDGGNVLKALVWKITGNPYKGIEFASRVGQFLGWTAIVLGVMAVLGLSQLGSIWTLLIGFFLLQNANRTAQFAEVQSKLDGLTAADAIVPDSPIVAQSATLRQFADQVLLSAGNGWQKFLVTDDTGRLVGLFQLEVLRDIPNDEWGHVQIHERMEVISNLETVESGKPLMDVVKLLEEKQLQSLVVTEANGLLLGLLEKGSIRDLLQRNAVEKLA